MFYVWVYWQLNAMGLIAPEAWETHERIYNIILVLADQYGWEDEDIDFSFNVPRIADLFNLGLNEYE